MPPSILDRTRLDTTDVFLLAKMTLNVRIENTFLTREEPNIQSLFPQDRELNNEEKLQMFSLYRREFLQTEPDELHIEMVFADLEALEQLWADFVRGRLREQLSEIMLEAGEIDLEAYIRRDSRVTVPRPFVHLPAQDAPRPPQPPSRCVYVHIAQAEYEAARGILMRNLARGSPSWNCTTPPNPLLTAGCATFPALSSSCSSSSVLHNACHTPQAIFVVNELNNRRFGAAAAMQTSSSAGRTHVSEGGRRSHLYQHAYHAAPHASFHTQQDAALNPEHDAIQLEINNILQMGAQHFPPQSSPPL